MFDKNRGISGENPEHIKWIKEVAIPRFESWGYEVKILHSDKDYLDCFNQRLVKSVHPERNGKKYGFPLAGRCCINDRVKMKPIRQFEKTLPPDADIIVGIAVDEPERLARLEKSNKRSLLAEYGYTEQMAYDLCKEYGLLSPTYEHSFRGGCWFCPNCSVQEFVHLNEDHSELWDELRKLDEDNERVSHLFAHNKTFEEVDAKVRSMAVSHRPNC